MSDRSSCDCFSEAEISFFDSSFNVFIRGGAAAVIVYTTFYLIDKIDKRFSRHEEKHESCED